MYIALVPKNCNLDNTDLYFAKNLDRTTRSPAKENSSIFSLKNDETTVF